MSRRRRPDDLPKPKQPDCRDYNCYAYNNIVCPAGPPGDLKNTAMNFCYAQLAHIIRQIIDLYPEGKLYVYTNSFYPSDIEGTPHELYSSPSGTFGGLFVVKSEDEYGAIPLQSITAIELSEELVYNDSITYLTPPILPEGFDKNIATAVHDYLPVSTKGILCFGAHLLAPGVIFKNESGIIVMTDEKGNSPTFIPTVNITGIYTTPDKDSTLIKENDKHTGSLVRTKEIPKTD